MVRLCKNSKLILFFSVLVLKGIVFPVGLSSQWPAPPIRNVIQLANTSDLLVIGQVVSKSGIARPQGRDSYYNFTLDVERVLKGSPTDGIVVRAKVMPSKSLQSNPDALIGDKVFLLLLEYPTNTSEKWYRLGASDYIWIINQGTIHNRWERHMKTSLDAPEMITKSYGWTYSLTEFLEVVETAIEDPFSADEYNLQPLPTKLAASIAIILLVTLPSIFIALVALFQSKSKRRNQGWIPFGVNDAFFTILS